MFQARGHKVQRNMSRIYRSRASPAHTPERVYPYLRRCIRFQTVQAIEHQAISGESFLTATAFFFSCNASVISRGISAICAGPQTISTADCLNNSLPNRWAIQPITPTTKSGLVSLICFRFPSCDITRCSRGRVLSRYSAGHIRVFSVIDKLIAGIPNTIQQSLNPAYSFGSRRFVEHFRIIAIAASHC